MDPTVLLSQLLILLVWRNIMYQVVGSFSVSSLKADLKWSEESNTQNHFIKT
jgi:hypothetical protein